MGWTVCYHHCNRLDPCSKQSPFLFELPLVFGFPSSRILGCDQYLCLNWEQRCFLWVVVWQEYVQHYTEIALHSASLYLHCCCLLCGVKPVWGVAQGEEKCTVPEAKQDWSRSLNDRCPVLQMSLSSSRESRCQHVIRNSCFPVSVLIWEPCLHDAVQISPKATSTVLEFLQSLHSPLTASSCSDLGSG